MRLAPGRSLLGALLLSSPLAGLPQEAREPAELDLERFTVAARLGYDRDMWFGNVEVAVGKAVGREPVLYVRDIYKNCVAYSLQIEARAERE